MNKLLDKPHPFIFGYSSVFIPGLLTFLIILVLAPLNFQALELPRRLWMALLFAGLVSLTIGTVVPTLRWFFPSFVNEDNWSVGKEILLYLMVVTLLVLVIFFTIRATGLTTKPLSMALFVKTTFLTITMSCLPILVLVLFEQFNYHRKQLQQAAELSQTLRSENQRLKREQAKPAKEQALKLRGENGKIELQLLPMELVCLRSDNNYVEVFYFLEGKIAKKLLRSRLKNIQELLPETYFLRCHNRYVVNGKHIVEISGNARNLELLLKGMPQKVPVSRAKAKLISDFIQTLA